MFLILPLGLGWLVTVDQVKHEAGMFNRTAPALAAGEALR